MSSPDRASFSAVNLARVAALDESCELNRPFINSWMLDYSLSYAEQGGDAQNAECIRTILKQGNVFPPEVVSEVHSPEVIIAAKKLRLYTLRDILSKPAGELEPNLPLAFKLIDDWSKVDDYEPLKQEIARQLVLSKLQQAVTTEMMDSVGGTFQDVQEHLSAKSRQEIGLILRVITMKKDSASKVVRSLMKL